MHSLSLLHLAGLLIVYLPVSSICYGILGNNGVPANILNAVNGPAVNVTQSFILCHFLFAFSVVINPVNQALESVFNMPNSKGREELWKERILCKGNEKEVLKVKEKVTWV